MDRKIERKQWSFKRVLPGVIFVVVVLILIYFGFFNASGSVLNVDADRITVSEVHLGGFQENIIINGTIVPVRSIFLDAVEGGRVDKVYHEGGSFVSAGDTLLVLSNNNLQLDVMNREAQILEQISNLRNTRIALQQQRIDLRSQLLTHETELQQREREYLRDSTLFARDLASVHQFEESKQMYQQVVSRRDLFREQLSIDSLATETQLVNIETSLVHMTKNLALVGGILEFLVVKAPIGGQLSALNAEIGETKTAGQRLGQIDVVDSHKIRAAIDEAYIARVMLGQVADFDFAGSTYQLEITRIFPEVLEGRFQVDLEFAGDQPESIRRGQSVRLRLSHSDRSDALLLSRGGFYQRTGGNWVFVLEPGSDIATRRNIRLGRQNAQYFVVESGLQAGDLVITSTYETFGDNDRLNIRGAQTIVPQR